MELTVLGNIYKVYDYKGSQTITLEVENGKYKNYYPCLIAKDVVVPEGASNFRISVRSKYDKEKRHWFTYLVIMEAF